MDILFNLHISFIHFILAYGILITTLISNDFKVLIGLLVIMSSVKFAFYIFGRCILTLYEYNHHFAPIVKLLSHTLSNNINSDKTGEEILINIGILIILNKLFFLTLYKYYVK